MDTSKYDRLAAFFRKVWDASTEDVKVDPYVINLLAIELELAEQVPYDPEKHGKPMSGRIYEGDTVCIPNINGREAMSVGKRIWDAIEETKQSKRKAG